MADPKPEPSPEEIKALISEGLSKVTSAVFATPSSSTPRKPAWATAKLVREIGSTLKPRPMQPIALACLPDGGVLILDRPAANRFRVLHCGAKGDAAAVAFETPRGKGNPDLMEPVSLAVDAQRQLFFVDAQEGCVKKFSFQGAWLDSYRSAGPTGKLFSRPLDVAVDEQGNLLIVDSNNNRVVKISADGELAWELDTFRSSPAQAEPDELYEPSSLCLGRGGILRVADRNENRVLGFDPQRKLIGLFPDIPFPSWVRMGPDGTTSFVSARNKITRHAASGAVTGVIEFPYPLEGGGQAQGGGALAVDGKGNVLIIDLVRESILVFAFAEK